MHSIERKREKLYFLTLHTFEKQFLINLENCKVFTMQRLGSLEFRNSGLWKDSKSIIAM